VEFFGSQLPVKINEILTFSDSKTTVSVSFSKNGWAWAVSGRKLLVWQYRDSRASNSTDSAKSNKSRSGTTSQCRLLTLPHCDIGHKARLITVFVPENSQMAVSCLAVSTTGDVRYWPSIAHDGSSIDENGILEGQEFDQLTSINPLGYLLVTTTCNLVLLQLQVQNGRQKIVHRTIRQPTGFLGGIGKRFSIIIGMNSNQESENRLIKICYESINTVEYHVTVLSDHSLQRWLFSLNTNDSFLYEDSEIQKKIREIYRQKIWTNRDVNETITLWMLDMQTVSKGVIILTGAANLAHTPEIHFSLGKWMRFYS
jgi:nuclear pore complex protein Nup133